MINNFYIYFKRKPCFDTGRKLSEEEVVVLAGNFDGHVGSKALRASMEDMDMEWVIKKEKGFWYFLQS